MIVRKVRPEELKRTQELFAIAFEFAAENEKSAEEVMDEICNHPKSREDVYWKERWAAFADNDTTMMCYLIAKPFPMQFDGNTYTMTGIGGVASLPQYRRQGGIRACFEAALPSMYEDGVAFSYLYPFSTAYYRKFGYELGCERNRYHIRLNSVRPFAVDGKCQLVEPGHFMQKEIEQIYRVWQNRYNMMIVNESYEFAWIEKSNPVQDQMFTYVYQSAAGIPMGYMTVKQTQETDGRNLLCTRFCFTCTEGLKGLLNLLLSLGSDHDYVTLELPTDVDIALLLPEWAQGAVTMARSQCGMVRVVHVEKVLRGARYQGSGKLTLRIRDDQIAENDDTFTITFANGRAESVVRDKDASFDISMGIREFSRLIIGAGDTDSLAFMDGVEVRGDLATIGQVFYRKPSLIMEYF